MTWLSPRCVGVVWRDKRCAPVVVGIVFLYITLHSWRVRGLLRVLRHRSDRWWEETDLVCSSLLAAALSSDGLPVPVHASCRVAMDGCGVWCVTAGA